MAKLSESQKKFLEQPYVGVATTLRKDGSPQNTVVWVDLEDGVPSFNTALGRAKPRHLEADPRAALIVVDPSDPFTWLAVDGHAEVTAEGAEARIDKIDPDTGNVVASIPAPGHGRDSGLAWAEGSLWVGQYRDRRIYQIDPETGAILRTIESNRFVTGVTWVDGELWHGTWEGEESTLRHIDPTSGAVLQQLDMPQGVGVSGLESDGAGLFYCGGGSSGKVRAVRRPRAGTAA